METQAEQISWNGPDEVILLCAVIFGVVFLIGFTYRLNYKLRAEVKKRDRNETLLAAREKLLSKVLDFAPDVALVLTRDGRYAEVLSPASSSLLKTPKELRGQLISDFIEDDIAQKMKNVIHAVLDSGEIHNFDYTLDIGGHERHFQAQVKPFPFVETGEDAVLWVAHDVTRYKAQEKALAESKRNLELALEGVSAGIWVFDMESNQVFRGGKWARHLGYEFDEMPPDPLAFGDFIKPEDFPAVFQAWTDHVDGRKPEFVSEHRMLRADGSDSWVLTWGRIVERNEAGRPKLAAGIHVDINKRKKMSAALEESELRYRLLIENIPHVTWLADLEGKTYFISSNVERVLGFDRERILDEGARLWEHRVHPDDLEKFKASLKLLLENSQAYDITYRFLRADGVYIWIREQTRITDMASGEQRVMGILLDVTQSIRDGERLKAALQEAQRLNNSRSLFMASVSHELRNSLHAITGLADLLLAERDTLKYPIHLAQLKYQTESLNYFASDILEYSSLESGNFKPVYSNFNLLELLDSLAELTRYKCAEKGLFFDYRLPLRFLKQYVHSDRFRLRQSLFNLLHNAVKFTQAGTVRFIIEIETVDAEINYYRLIATVSDTGEGIPAELQEMIFQPYFTKGAQHGAGLGLAIVKGMISALKGTITVKSNEGQGSIFSINIPISFEDSGDNPAMSDSLGKVKRTGQENQSAPARPLKILVVDDEPVNRHLTVSWLEARNFECEHESNGELALSRALSRKFDAVLCDLHLPGMSGASLARAIRSQIAKSEQMPLFALSADTTEAMRKEALEAGFDAVFAKPMALSAVETLLASLPNREASWSQYGAYADDAIPEKKAELAHLFQAELPEYHAKIKKLAQQENWHGILEQLHKIKGALTVIGHTELKAHSENLESVLRTNQFGDDLKAEASSEYLERLDSYVERLRATP